MDKGEGVKKYISFADIIYEWPQREGGGGKGASGQMMSRWRETNGTQERNGFPESRNRNHAVCNPIMHPFPFRGGRDSDGMGHFFD